MQTQATKLAKQLATKLAKNTHKSHALKQIAESFPTADMSAVGNVFDKALAKRYASACGMSGRKIKYQ